MQKLEVASSESVQAALRHEAEHSPQSRYLHRLHCLMLVAAGRSCYEVAKVFGDDPRSVERWVRKYQKNGVAGLREKLHTGRHATLDDAQMHQLVLALQSPPRECGHVDSAWSGKLLRAEIQRRFGSSLSARHCQRLFNGMQSSRF